MANNLIRRISYSLGLLLLIVAVPELWAGSIDVTVASHGTVYLHPKNGFVSGTSMSAPEIDILSNVFGILTGRMRFVTGPETGHQGMDYFFGNGGSLVVSGCMVLDTSHANKCDKKDFRGILLTAKFISAEIVEKGGKFFLEAEVLETINPKLAAMLKLSKDTYFAQLDLALANLGKGKYSVLSESLFTLSEPPSLVLLMFFLALTYFLPSLRQPLMGRRLGS